MNNCQMRDEKEKGNALNKIRRKNLDVNWKYEKGARKKKKKNKTIRRIQLGDIADSKFNHIC